MHSKVTWLRDQQYDGESASGNRVTMDASPAHTAGTSPMELMLMALCGCTSVDVVSILQKKREPVTSLVVSAVAEQAESAPRVFTHIHLTYHIEGNVSAKAAEDAVSLSKNKYCSVSKMLEKAVTIDYEITYGAQS
jgi:putative redox protein